MKVFNNAWVWFGLFCVGLFLVTYWGLGMVVRAMLQVEPTPNYTTSSLKVQPNYGKQTEQGYKLQPAVNPNAYSTPLKTTTSLVELWQRESWAVQQTKKVLVSDSKAVQQVLLLETPQLSPGLERL